MMYDFSTRIFNIIQNFGDPSKTTTTISTGASVKQERMCKSESSNTEQSEAFVMKDGVLHYTA